MSKKPVLIFLIFYTAVLISAAEERNFLLDDFVKELEPESIYLQLGAFKKIENAAACFNKYSSFAELTVLNSGDGFYKILAGPYSSHAELESGKSAFNADAIEVVTGKKIINSFTGTSYLEAESMYLEPGKQYIQFHAFKTEAEALNAFYRIRETEFRVIAYSKGDGYIRFLFGPFEDVVKITNNIRVRYNPAAFVFTEAYTAKLKDVPVEVNAVITELLLEKLSLTEKAKIYTGLTPPDICGEYYADSFIVGYDESGDTGHRKNNYRIIFYDQKPDGTIRLKYKSESGDENTHVGEGKGAFISGSGNNFTVYMHTASTDGNSWSRAVEMYSGIFDNENGIKDFSNVFYIKEKNDPYDELIGIGMVREVYEEDGMLEKFPY